MATIYGRNVPSEPEGPQAVPGNYSVKLTVNGQSSTQPLKLVMDPRVATSAQDLEKQFALETKLTQGIQQARRALDEIHSYYVSHPATEGDSKLQELAQIEPQEGRQRRGGKTISGTVGTLAQLLGAVDSADTAPTVAETKGAEQALTELQTLLDKWEALQK